MHELHIPSEEIERIIARKEQHFLWCRRYPRQLAVLMTHWCGEYQETSDGNHTRV